MDRNEQIGVELTRDLAPLLQHQEAVVRTGQGNAELAAFDQFVADRARYLECDILLLFVTAL